MIADGMKCVAIASHVSIQKQKTSNFQEVCH